jgi:hypothetical protein
MAGNLVDPTPRRLERAARGWESPPARLVCVYRYRNHPMVERLVSESSLPAALWALDRPHPVLARWTVGDGPGGRFELLNRLTGESGDDYLVVTDDDVTFAPAGLTTALRTAHRLGLDLAQPAHGPLSRCSWDFNRVRPGRVARRTLWVEVGPTLIFSPHAQERLLPFPEDEGMGWGIEAEWYKAAREGLVLAVIDGVRMRHRGVVAASYNRADALRASASVLAANGVSWTSDMQVEVSNWRSIPHGSSA